MEAYPQSKPQIGATTTVKVSLDEWAEMRRGANAELMTDGLSGCVAVAIRTDDKIALTHVYSDAYNFKRNEHGEEDRFDAYKSQLGEFVASVGSRDAIREVHLVHNGNPVAERRERNLAGMIEDHLVKTGAVHGDRIRTHIDSGCTITDSDFYTKSRDNQQLYVRGYTNTQLDELHGDLAKPLKQSIHSGVFAGSLGHPAPCDIDSTPRNGQAVAHDPRAKYSDAPPKREPDPIEDAPSIRRAYPYETLIPAIKGHLKESKEFGFSPIRQSDLIAQAAYRQGVLEVSSVEIDRTARTIVVNGNGQSVPFAYNDKKEVVELARGSQATHQASSSSEPQPASKPQTLYEQALAALQPHRSQLKLQDPAHAQEVAREIASQANRDGMTGISRLEMATPEHGKPMLVAHQDGSSTRQSQPMAVETLLQNAGAAPRTPSQPGPDKDHFPIM
jgi:hypothetical protein